MSQLYLAPYFAPEFHLSDTQVGFLASAVAVTWALSGLFFGAISDRFGRRVILIPSVIIFSALSWLSGIAHSFEQLLLIRGLMGVAEGPCWAVINAINEESSSPSRRGRNVGLVVSAAALVGLFLAPILTTQVASRFGWRWGFFVTGLPGILMAFLIWKFVKEPVKRFSGVAVSARARQLEGLSFDSAISKRLAVRDWRRRIPLLAISAKRICAAVYNGGCPPGADDGRFFTGRGGAGKLFCRIDFSGAFRSFGAEAHASVCGRNFDDSAHRAMHSVAIRPSVAAGGNFVLHAGRTGHCCHDDGTYTG